MDKDIRNTPKVEKQTSETLTAITDDKTVHVDSQIEGFNNAAERNLSIEELDGLDKIAEAKEIEALTRQKQDQHDNNKIISPGRLVLKRFFRSKLSIIGLAMIVFLFLFAFLGPLFSPYGEREQTGDHKIIQTHVIYTIVDEDGVEYTLHEIRETTVQGYTMPSWKHWLGTDGYSFDILTRLMYGGRISLAIGFLVVFAEILLGVLLGGVSGFFGKWSDQIIMRIVDIMNCIPGLPLLLISGALIDALGTPPEQKIYWLMGVLTIFSWGGTARLVRGQILMFKEQDFMIAAEATGLTTSRKIFKHLLPNVLPQLIVQSTLGLGSVILYESTLSYLGLGVPFPYAAWGSMIGLASPSTGSGREILSYYPNMWVPAGVCIVMAVLGFNFVGDGLRDAFDPKMKR